MLLPSTPLPFSSPPLPTLQSLPYTGSEPFLSQAPEALSAPQTVEAVPLADFSGFSWHDQPALKALLTFTYNATLGNMDEAFRAIKVVKRCVQGRGARAMPLTAHLVTACNVPALMRVLPTASATAERSGRTWRRCVCVGSGQTWLWCV